MSNVQNVNSFNQLGGITAGTVNFGKQQRYLDNKLKKDLVSELNQSSEVCVCSILGDIEAFNYASEIKNFLSNEGYKVDGVDQVVYNGPIPPLEGVRISENKYEIRVGSQ